MTTTNLTSPSSPRWSSTTKLVIALTVVALLAAFVVRFKFIITPLMIALILAYLRYPLASFMQRKVRFSWGASVGVIYLLVIVILLGLLTLSGVGLVQQVQSVVTIVDDGIRALPGLIANLSGHVYQFGPFTLDTSTLDLSRFSEQVLGMVQPMLSRTGAILSTVAGKTVNFLGWTLFVLLVSYFILVESGGLRDLELPQNALGAPHVVAEGATVVLVAGSPTIPNQVVRLDVATESVEVLRTSAEVPVDCGFFSVPRPIEFPTEGGLTAHALYYPPTNPRCIAPEEDSPPLIVLSHGGPTGNASAIFSLGAQFWTSRGFALVDVNYGGSTGYGRAYRERLNGQWGVVDLQDCVNAAMCLVERGEVDPDRLLIRGGSAGGYTTICALTFTDAFAAGAAYFGLADLEPFATGDTHKFESGYEHTLVGPYPEAADVYRARSPIHFVDQIATPMLVLQGADDEVVPPSQAELIVTALRKRGIPHAYLLFEGEGHGFRKAENIVRSLEAELSFYAQVLGFEPGDPVPKLPIEHLPA